MRRVVSPHRRPRWPVVLAILVPPLAVAAVWAANSSPEPEGQDLWVGASPFGPASMAPAGEIEVVHLALHDIGARCLTDDPDLGAIAADVDRIIDFSRQYPVGRFPIDDETATASSFLLITREAVKTCAPAEVDRIDVARQ